MSKKITLGLLPQWSGSGMPRAIVTGVRPIPKTLHLTEQLLGGPRMKYTVLCAQQSTFFLVQNAKVTPAQYRLKVQILINLNNKV